MTVRISPEVSGRLEALARDTKRSKTYLAGEAIADFVKRNAWQVAHIKSALAKPRVGPPVSRMRIWNFGRTRGHRPRIATSGAKSLIPYAHHLASRSTRGRKPRTAIHRTAQSRSAQRVVLAIYAAVRQIAGAPDLGRPGRVARTRELVVPGHLHRGVFCHRGHNHHTRHHSRGAGMAGRVLTEAASHIAPDAQNFLRALTTAKMMQPTAQGRRPS